MDARARGINCNTALSPPKPSKEAIDIDAARAIDAIIAPQYDSKISDPMPATSPTLSPTLSAMTAGLRGSSSGIPASTLPTRSAPTSADLVNIPPPTRLNRATEEPPIAKPSIDSMPCKLPPINPYSTPIPNKPMDATVRPIIEPPKNATFNASEAPLVLAATAVLTFAFVAVYIPM